MTDLDAVAIGCIVWSAKHRKAGEGSESTQGGMVVDVGLYEDTGGAYVEVLDESVPNTRVQFRTEGSKTWRPMRPAGLRRIDLAEVDETAITEPDIQRMHAWAKKALLGACVMPWGAHYGHDLVVAAGTLLLEAKRIGEAEQARVGEHVAEFNEQLEATRAARRQAS